MHLKSLTLKGFKSFASATTLKFEPGICAVVGPNGSGKSNVVDALAWVMGEQGAKTLRGGKMQDVIFAGAGDRRPLGRAEVTLTIDNSDGALPIEYSEVSITRRMFRDGASEYEINGARARLMDIQELLSDSGIGREMHVIVGQGRLSQILESRPEERRSFIEEAAGVLKHRRRREKAQRKLVGMQTNLDRLTDLNRELSRQLKPLARQAETARRADTVQAELREARLRLAGDRVVGLRARFSDAARQTALLAEQVAQVTAEVEEAGARQAELTRELDGLTPRAEAAQQLWFRLSTLSERVSATSRIAAERAGNVGVQLAFGGPDPEELEARAEAAEQEHAGLVEDVEIARARLESIREEVADREEAARAAEAEHLAQVRAIADRREGVVRLLAAEESLAGQVTAAEAEGDRQAEAVEETRERVMAAEAEVTEVTERLVVLRAGREPLAEEHGRAAGESQAAEQRLEELRERQRGRERAVYSLDSRIETLRQSAPVADAAEALARHGRWAPLAGSVRPTAGLERALSAALGTHAEALVGQLGEGLISELSDTPVARTALIDVAQGTGGWRLSADLPAGTGWLLDHLVLDESVVGPVTRLLADVILAPDVAAAQAAVTTDPRLRAVTPDGTLLGEGWAEVGHGASSSVELSARIAEAETELLTARAELGELSGMLEGAKLTAEEARVGAAARRAALRDHDAAVTGWERDAGRLNRQLEANRAEHRRAVDRAGAGQARLAELRDRLDEARDRLARVEAATATPEEPSTRERDEAATALTQIRAMEMEARLSLHSAEERAGQAAGRSEHLHRQARQERQARQRHEQAMERRRHQAELAQTVEHGARDLAARVAEATARAAVERDGLTRGRTEVSSRLAAARDTLNAARTHLNRLTDTAHTSEIARAQAQVRTDEAETKIVEQLGLSIEDLLADHTPGPDFDREAEQERLRRAERDLNALGKVNPLALEEYRALEERHSFLSTQLADVVQARRDLHEVIEEVDAQILHLFTEAWHDVEAAFPDVFATLFPGGQGRLVLTDPEDLLTTGIEVEARPPGKKVTRLSLLSGGEKSLTALAMLVAIFRARPSPFYVMDEVEAALDDVNLRRLIALFEEMRRDSQLIIITHQKPTMDVANVLYGVTMRGDGITRVISQRMSPAGPAPDAPGGDAGEAG